MQDGTKREALSWKLSAVFFWWFLVLLNVFVCNMLLKNTCKNHQKYVRKTDENGPKMVPKPLQNRSWRGSGGHLGATLETRCFQDFIFDDVGSILGPPLGPVWAHFRDHVFDVFLRWLFDGFGLHLGSPNTSKMKPKRGQNQKLKFIDFACIYNTLATFEGSENHHFSMFFWNPILGCLLDPILKILAHFWGPFWRPFSSLFGYPFCINF